MDNINRQNEAFECFMRIKPIMQEYFDDWIVTAHRAGCKTKVILGDYDKKLPDMNRLMNNAKQWKKGTL